MSIVSPNPYPTDNCYMYYQGSSQTHVSAYNRGLAGQSSSYNYTWFLPFNLSAYANRIITNITFWAKRCDTNSNSVASTKKIAASYGTTAAGATGTKPDLGNAKSLIDGDSWNSWDVTAAAATLKAGTGYIYLYNTAGQAYTEFYNNNNGTNGSAVAAADRPYLVVTLQDGLVEVFDSGYWRLCEAYVFDGYWRLCEPKVFEGYWRLLG